MFLAMFASILLLITCCSLSWTPVTRLAVHGIGSSLYVVALCSCQHGNEKNLCTIFLFCFSMLLPLWTDSILQSISLLFFYHDCILFSNFVGRHDCLS